MLFGNLYSNKLNLPPVQEEKQIIFLPLVGGWVVGGIVDGAVDNNYKICYLETYTATS